MRAFFSAAAGGDFDLSKYFEWGKSDYSIGNAALVAVVGVVIVLVILLMLVLILMAFNKIFVEIEKRGKKAVEAKTSVSAQTASPAAYESANDEETTAAIMAAISCIYAQESRAGSASSFIVRRIRQVKNSKR